MDNNKLSSIEKALLILDGLSESPFEQTATSLSNILGINRTTIHRTLDTLVDNDFVMRNELSKTYRLGPKLYRMGSIYLNNFNYKNKISELLNEISQKTKESVGYAIRDEDKVISLYEIEFGQPLKMNYKAGMFYPMNRGCYGKCLMAYYNQDEVKALLEKQKFEKVCENTLTTTKEILEEYEKIRKQGFVISVEETFRYAIGVGVPIVNGKNKVVSCLAVAFLKDDCYLEKIERFKEILFFYKNKIEKYMP